MFRLFKKDKSASSATGPIDFLIVGLGNPGTKYENTRHNVGFMAVDLIAEQNSSPIKSMKFKGLISRVKLGDKNVLLLKPSTFMNLSGQSVVEAMNFYKLSPEQVIIIFDDISLEPGKIRVRRKGSDGGQNGIKNIIYLSGSDNFPRIKIGVGAKPHPNYDLAAWVLSRFTDKEQTEINSAVKNAGRAAEIIINENIDEAMSQFN